MNAPAAPVDQSNAPSWVRHRALRQWVSEVARLAKPERIVWCDGSQAEYDRLCAELVAAGTFIRLNPKLRPELLPRALASERRGAHGRPHLHLQREEGRRRARPTTGSTRARCARTLEPPVRRLHARAHDVRDAVLDGADRLADRAGRRRDLRFGLRRGQHAHHDAHGPRGGRLAGRGPARSCRACIRSARRSRRARRTSPGRATTRKSGSCISPRRARSGRSARATAATRCSARSASRCASPRSWRATKAGSPSTC